MVYAILIDPAKQEFKIVRFEPDDANTSQTIMDILGGKITHVHDFESGDQLFTLKDAETNLYNLAFSLTGTEKIFYGKAVVVGFSRNKIRIINSRFTIEKLTEQVKFYIKTEMEDLKKNKQ